MKGYKIHYGEVLSNAKEQFLDREFEIYEVEIK